jgi:hypothetical protein
MDDNSSFDTVISARNGWFDIHLGALLEFGKRIMFHFSEKRTRPSGKPQTTSAVLWKCPPARAFTA